MTLLAVYKLRNSVCEQQLHLVGSYSVHTSLATLQVWPVTRTIVGDCQWIQLISTHLLVLRRQ